MEEEERWARLKYKDKKKKKTKKVRTCWWQVASGQEDSSVAVLCLEYTRGLN